MGFCFLAVHLFHVIMYVLAGKFQNWSLCNVLRCNSLKRTYYVPCLIISEIGQVLWSDH